MGEVYRALKSWRAYANSGNCVRGSAPDGTLGVRELVRSRHGAGALIGVLMDMAAADTHVVHAAATSTVRVAPTLTPTRAGGTLTVRW